MGPAKRWGLESRGQPPCKPFVHLPGENMIGMHWQPHILPIAPDMVSQTDGHRWGPQRATLPQAGSFSFWKVVANQAENELKGFGPRGALLDRHAPYDPKPFHLGRLS